MSIGRSSAKDVLANVLFSVFTLGATVINFAFVAFDQTLTPLWVAIIANFCFMTFYTLYLWGVFVQELDFVGLPLTRVDIS